MGAYAYNLKPAGQSSEGILREILAQLDGTSFALWFPVLFGGGGRASSPSYGGNSPSGTSTGLLLEASIEVQNRRRAEQQVEDCIHAERESCSGRPRRMPLRSPLTTFGSAVAVLREV